MSQFTSEWYQIQQSKRERSFPSTAPVLVESKLHDSIIDYCKSKSWYYVRSRMDCPSTNGVGTPDFIIACKHGITLWIECKAKGNKVTVDQQAVKYWLQTNGHKAYVVWSMDEFLAVVQGLE